MDELFSLLTLLSVPGVGPKRIRSLIQAFGSAGAVLEASPSDLRAIEGIDRVTADHIHTQADPHFAEAQIRRADRQGVRLVPFWGEEYPKLLKTVPDAPALLYIKGPLDLSNVEGVAIVGTRNPTPYGRRMAETLARQLARCGLGVVSGLARGIDTAAHRGALREEGQTIAVLGCGADVIYPFENRDLYEAITEKGAIVSELPLGTPPSGPYFPKRNRIISGLSLGTVIVEAGYKSGALITAYLALEQNREVFAVPGPVTNLQSKGPHRLIRQGAKLVEGADDILQEFPAWRSRMSTSAQPSPPLEALGAIERKIWEGLSDSPVHIDALAESQGLSTPEALTALLAMEIKGYVKQLPGMVFIRSGA